MAFDKEFIHQFMAALERQQCEYLAMKAVLISHRVPKWKQAVHRLANHPDTIRDVHALFQPVYERLEKQGNPEEALQEFLKAVPKGKVQ